MSVFNHEEFLDESIQSILNQTFKDFEFIIINDASTDSTLEIIKKYQIKDKRIQLIINKKNIGLTKSLNKGLKISKGKYIARQDADDVSLPKRLEKQYEFLEKNKQIILCGTDYINIDDKGQKLPKRRVIYDWKKIKKILPKDNPFVHSSIMFRNKGLFYREKFELAQDYDLYLNLLTKGMKMINLKRVLIKHRYNLETMSVYGAGKRLQLIKIIRYFYKQF